MRRFADVDDGYPIVDAIACSGGGGGATTITAAAAVAHGGCCCCWRQSVRGIRRRRALGRRVHVRCHATRYLR